MRFPSRTVPRGALGRAQPARFLRAPGRGAERSDVVRTRPQSFFFPFSLFSLSYIPPLSRKKKEKSLPTILESKIHMQKLRNYVKFSTARVINYFYFPSALPRARQLIAMTSLVDLGYFRPLTARHPVTSGPHGPRKLAADALMEPCETTVILRIDMIWSTRKITRTKSARET